MSYIINVIYVYVYIKMDIYRYGILFSLEKKAILPFATWMNLKGIMLDETGQKKKDRYYMILLTYGI